MTAKGVSSWVADRRVLTLWTLPEQHYCQGYKQVAGTKQVSYIHRPGSLTFTSTCPWITHHHLTRLNTSVKWSRYMSGHEFAESTNADITSWHILKDRMSQSHGGYVAWCYKTSYNIIMFSKQSIVKFTFYVELLEDKLANLDDMFCMSFD